MTAAQTFWAIVFGATYLASSSVDKLRQNRFQETDKEEQQTLVYECKLTSSSLKVHRVVGNEGSLLVELPESVESDEDWNGNVVDDKSLHVPATVEEDGESVEDDDDGNKDETKVRRVRLEWSDVGECRSVDTLFSNVSNKQCFGKRKNAHLSLATVVESDVGEEN